MANPNKSNSQLADPTDKPMIGSQQALVADADVAHSLNATFSNTEAQGALDALGGKINSILGILEAHGLMADA